MIYLAGTHSPSGGRHDAAAVVGRHPTTAAPLRRVVIHAKVVSELVGQGDRRSQGVVRVVLGTRRDGRHKARQHAAVAITGLKMQQMQLILKYSSPH